MAYDFASRVRYSELGADKKLSLVSLVDYFQDCSTFQSEDLGRGMGYLEENHRVWMILSWQIEIQRRPGLGERITARTWPYGFKAFYGYRNFILLDEQGEELARANSVWVYIDTQTGRPAKVLPENISGYECEPPLEGNTVSRKIRVPEGCDRMEPILVGRQHLDSNYHVNNGQYVRMAEKFVPEGFELTGFQVEYRQQARLNDKIIPMVHIAPGEVTVSLNSEEQKPYAVIVFRGNL